MRKIYSWISDNLLFLSTLFLLVFIPLYPKLPLIDIKNTWVYVRAEDFVVLAVLFLWLVFLIKKKITFRTPLTIPILAFWMAGAIATVHGILLVFPNSANVFPNVAFLNYIRHIEYLSVFFVAFAGMRNKNFLKVVIVALVLTLLGVIFYGFGQRYLGFPAYLTMNEEFAKGIPIQLSSLSRVPSTFAGHYDLAAYLVLIIPIIASLIFGFKNWIIKIALGISVILGIVLLFMTVSRVSFFVLVVALMLVLFFQKRRFFLYSIPVVIAFGFVFLVLKPTTLLERFGNTVKEVNVLVDAQTGVAIGHVTYVPPEYFDDKIIGQQNIEDKTELDTALGGKLDDDTNATPSALLPAALFPDEVPLVVDTNVSTGENLPQGTGYINLSLSPVEKKLGNFFYEITKDENSTSSAQVLIFHGDFLVKKAAAYDLSFTTRVQGEWPNALKAFERNIFLGSGYGSISLAIDNNYLRILGETGLLGTLSFIGIFLILGIYIKNALPKIESKVVRSFVLGFSAGVVGLSLNAVLIDVFEASKVAFTLWVLTGVVVGLLALYQSKESSILEDLKAAAASPYAVIVYLLTLIFVIYSPILNNYFIGDDFTWFRWAADCRYGNLSFCPDFMERILGFFTQADKFFYRPGTKTYFLLMYSVFWLNQVVFHAVSLALHFVVAVLFFFLARKILNNTGLAVLASILFVVMSGYSEMVFWISATGHLFNAVFILGSLLLFILWKEKHSIFYYLGALILIFLSTFFHELGVVAPFLAIAYGLTHASKLSLRRIYKMYDYIGLFIPVVIYLVMRFIANSHWSGGDYSYNLLKLPFNILGNTFGYSILTLFGPNTLPVYQSLRDIIRDNLIVASAGMLLAAGGLYLIYRFFIKRIDSKGLRIIAFGAAFFIIALLPFIGLGNIASRYSYLASLGLIIVLVYFINKLYLKLKVYGKDIAIGGMTVALSVFALLHIIQVQQLHMDWRTAGNKVERFFISLDSLYRNTWSKDDAQLHIVNVPIKHGDAWIFPVGIEDAIWLTFQNSDLKIYKYPDLKSALDAAQLSPNKWVLEFEDDGGVREVVRFRNRITGEMDYELNYGTN